MYWPFTRRTTRSFSSPKAVERNQNAAAREGPRPGARTGRLRSRGGFHVNETVSQLEARANAERRRVARVFSRERSGNTWGALEGPAGETAPHQWYTLAASAVGDRGCAQDRDRRPIQTQII